MLCNEQGRNLTVGKTEGTLMVQEEQDADDKPEINTEPKWIVKPFELDCPRCSV